MSNVPFYYNQYTAKERSYVEYMGEINKSISSEVERNTNKQIAANAAIAGRLASEIDYSMVQMQTGIQTSINRQTSEIIASNNVLTQTYQQGYNELNNTLDIGFSGLSNKLGQMGAAFSLGLDRISDTLKGMSKEICDKLDAIHDIINNPLLTQSRELFRRAIVNYNKGFFEESLEDIQAAVEKYKTDYMSWFLMGKLLAFGTGEFSNVINLEAAINAFTQAAKYNSPNISESTDARLLSVEIYFYLGTTQYAQSNELLRTRKENEASEMLANALKSFEKSFLYSEKMLESLFNIARCKVLLNQKKAALIDLENLILLDRNYCIKAFNDYDFLNISEELIELINKLKHEFFINNTEIKYKKIICLIDELKELNGFYKDHSKIPSNFTENLPYFDIMDYNLKFTAMIPQIEEAIQEQRKKNEKTIQEQRRKNEEAKLKQKEQEFKILKTQELKEPRKKLEKYIDVISAGTFHTVCLKNNGTVVAVGANKNGQCNIDSWHDLVTISAGRVHTVGLKSDGTVVAVGANDKDQCNTGNWYNIIAIAAGNDHTVGLKSDGTVVAVGANEKGQCNIDSWRDLVTISAGNVHTVGLKSDGTVVAVGSNEKRQCNIVEWNDIIVITTGSNHTVGLKSDGTVVAVGAYVENQCNTNSWCDIVAISAGDNHTIGLKSDGTVVAVGANKNGQCNIDSWCDIVAISAGHNHTIGLKSDGTVVAVGANEKGQCNTGSWRDIGPFDKEQVQRLEEQQRQWKQQGLCIYCGGQMGGLFTKKCKSCGK